MEEEYQRQKNQKVQKIRHEEKFDKVRSEYSAQEEAQQRQVDVLSQQLIIVNDQTTEAQKNLNRVRECDEQLTTESEDIQQQLQVVDYVILKTVDQVVESDKMAISQMISSMEQTETISNL